MNRFDPTPPQPCPPRRAAPASIYLPRRATNTTRRPCDRANTTGQKRPGIIGYIPLNISVINNWTIVLIIMCLFIVHLSFQYPHYRIYLPSWQYRNPSLLAACAVSQLKPAFLRWSLPATFPEPRPQSARMQ